MTHRETLLRSYGQEVIVRTEMGGPIRTRKQLEAAHYKAVKAQLTRFRTDRIDTHYRDMLPTESGAAEATKRARKVWTNKDGSVTAYGQKVIDSAADDYRERTTAHADKWRAAELKRAKVENYPYRDSQKLRRPHPPIRYTYPEIPKSVKEYAE